MKYIIAIILVVSVSHVSIIAQETKPLEGKTQGSNRIILRNPAAMGVDDKPLYIIENFIVDESGLAAIDPKTIKSINVYKGDKAIELYGESGGNGVIVVELKKKYAKRFKRSRKTKIE